MENAVLLAIRIDQAPGPSISQDSNFLRVVRVLKKIATDVDNEGNRFAADHRNLIAANQLYRFSVSHDSTEVELQE